MKWFEDTFLKSIFEKQGENVDRMDILSIKLYPGKK